MRRHFVVFFTLIKNAGIMRLFAGTDVQLPARLLAKTTRLLPKLHTY
jgi:hypothetical protein